MSDLEIVPVIGARVGWKDFVNQARENETDIRLIKQNEIITDKKRFIFVNRRRQIQGLNYSTVVYVWGADLLDEFPLILSEVKGRMLANGK